MVRRLLREMEILNQKYTITRYEKEKFRELKSQSYYFQEYFIRIMNTKNGSQNPEKMVCLKGGYLQKNFH